MELIAPKCKLDFEYDLGPAPGECPEPEVRERLGPNRPGQELFDPARDTLRLNKLCEACKAWDPIYKKPESFIAKKCGLARNLKCPKKEIRFVFEEGFVPNIAELDEICRPCRLFKLIEE